MREYEIGINSYNKLLCHVDKTLKHDSRRIDIYKRLINGLEHYENRVINIRIKSIIQGIFKEYSVSYYKRYGWYELCISNMNSCERFDITLASREEGIKITRFKISYLKKKLNDLEEKHKKDILQSENIIEIVGQYNSALKYFKNAQENLYKIPNWSTFDRF